MFEGCLIIISVSNIDWASTCEFVIFTPARSHCSVEPVHLLGQVIKAWTKVTVSTNRCVTDSKILCLFVSVACVSCVCMRFYAVNAFRIR